MTDIIRIVRVLEYTGPRDQLEKALAQNAVKGTQEFGAITIREAFLGSYPEVVGQVKPKIIIGLEARDWDEFICSTPINFPTMWLGSSHDVATKVAEDMRLLGYGVKQEGCRLTIHAHKILGD